MSVGLVHTRSGARGGEYAFLLSESESVIRQLVPGMDPVLVFGPPPSPTISLSRFDSCDDDSDEEELASFAPQVYNPPSTMIETPVGERPGKERRLKREEKRSVQ